MTATTLNNGITLGDVAGNNIGPVKTTLQAGTVSVAVSAQVTLAARKIHRGNSPKLYYVTSPISLTAGNAYLQLRPQAEYVDIVMPHDDSINIYTVATPVFKVAGQYLYTWLETPLFTSPVTITTVANELAA